jgi:2-methylisocitrate lyase-like PEP mutase family enzyme
MTFLEAPESVEQMKGTGLPALISKTHLLRSLHFVCFVSYTARNMSMTDYCRLVPGPKLANMLEQGSTPILSPAVLKEMGYTMAAYPLTLLSSSIRIMEESLRRIRDGTPTDDLILSFGETKATVGFSQYSSEETKYRVD